MKALILPGGGAKVGGILGAATAVINSGYSPNVYAGLSAGSLVAAAACTESFDAAHDALDNIGVKDVFTQPPVNKKGKISVSAALNIICGEHSLGKMNGNFIDLLKSVFTQERFEATKKNMNRFIYVQVVNMHTGAIEIVNILTLEYEEALCYLSASSSIPVFAEGWFKDDHLIMDGGVRSHLPSRAILENEMLHLTEVVSVYSRPEKLSDALSKDWQPNTVLDVLERNIEIQNIEISKRDAEHERIMCKMRGIKLTQIFLDLPQNGFYDFNSERMKESFEIGFDTAWKVMKRRPVNI